jgi:putative DNA primase/helicase
MLFLDEIFLGDKDLIGFIKRVIGYVLTGDVSEQVLFFFFGTGRNGKTTLIEIVLSLLGEFGIQAAPEILSLRNGEVHPTEQADLFGVRLAAAQEVKEGGLWDERAVKALTGGDRIRARKMRQDFVEFPPTHKFIVCANHKPVVKGVDVGIWRRIKMVPFKATIPAEKCDPRLPEKLRAELPGILNWAVEGCLEWQKAGLAPPPQVEAATSSYKAENDVVGRFLDEVCQIESTARINNADLYRAFQDWCKDTGEHFVSARSLGERLEDRGLPMRKVGGVNLRLGVRLSQAHEGPVLVNTRAEAEVEK